ncbi:MAG: hypothetical protein ACXW3O_16535 [Brevundimonas sp.]
MAVFAVPPGARTADRMNRNGPTAASAVPAIAAEMLTIRRQPAYVGGPGRWAGTGFWRGQRHLRA